MHRSVPFPTPKSVLHSYKNGMKKTNNANGGTCVVKQRRRGQGNECFGEVEGQELTGRSRDKVNVEEGQRSDSEREGTVWGKRDGEKEEA